MTGRSKKTMIWQRFTDGAKRVIVSGHESAAANGSQFVTPEHLLLAILQDEDSVSRKVLETMHVSLSRMRRKLDAELRGGRPHKLNNVLLDPRSKPVLDSAIQEAESAQKQYVGSEDLLVGILLEGEGTAFDILAYEGVTVEECRAEIARALRQLPPAAL